MGKTDVMLKCAVQAAAAALAACLVVALYGCGSSEPDTSAYGGSGDSRSAHVAASGPAIEVELKFEQIALESAPKRVTDSHGLAFLHFRYADTDGKVYKCVLPAAMAKEARTPAQWLGLFEMYREPEAVAKKEPRPTAPHTIGDFPFISPRPAAGEAPKPEGTEAATERPITPIPNLPAMPTRPGAPGAAPGVMPSPAAPMPGPGARPMPVGPPPGPEGAPPTPPG